jgi:hypothetical protein
MANFVIKPTSSNDTIKFQGSDDSAQFTIAGTTGSLGSGIAFPSDHVIKIYQKVFKGTQTISSVNGNSGVQYSATPDSWVLIGTGASGAEGEPLAITTDTPVSSSSKYLIRCNISHSRRQSGSAHMKWWYRVSGSGSAFASIVEGSGTGLGSNWIRYAFGSSHNSTTGGYGYHGIRQGTMEYLWSPNSASAMEIQCRMFVFSDDMQINRDTNNDNYNYMGNAISTFTIQEIAG